MVSGKIYKVCQIKQKHGPTTTGVSVVQIFIVPIRFIGGRSYTLKWVFWFQLILANRYNHRTELWVVSIESPSSVEYGSKIFVISFLQCVIEI